MNFLPARHGQEILYIHSLQLVTPYPFTWLSGTDVRRCLSGEADIRHGLTGLLGLKNSQLANIIGKVPPILEEVSRNRERMLSQSVIQSCPALSTSTFKCD